jgi:hypothetical protein
MEKVSARTGYMRNAYKILNNKGEGKTCVGGRMIIKWITTLSNPAVNVCPTGINNQKSCFFSIT